jgi:hypothetical protein
MQVTHAIADPAAMLQLQGSAGNAAATALLARAVGSPARRSALRGSVPSDTSAATANRGVLIVGAPLDEGLSPESSPAEPEVLTSEEPTASTGGQPTSTPADGGAPAPATPTNAGSPSPATPTNAGSPSPATPTNAGSPSPATPADAGAPVPATPKVAHVVMMAPSGSELWWFDGGNPGGYPSQQPLQATAAGTPGTFRWRVVRGASFADFGGSAAATGPTVSLVSKAPSAALRDVAVVVDFTGSDGSTGTASFSFTVRAPHHMTRLGTETTNNAPTSYSTLVSYSIQDQFATTLPRNVPINEKWDVKPPKADFAGTNWPSFPLLEGSAIVNPAKWSDEVTMSTSTPTLMIPPILASGGVLVESFPGHWQVGQSATGAGHRVLDVTWQFFQDRGAHA